MAATAPDKASWLLDNIYTAVLLFDSDLRLRDINAAGENLFLLSRRRMQGQSAYELLPAAESLVENLQRVLTVKQPFMEWGVELRLPNGKSLTADCRLTPVLDGETCKEAILELINADSYSRAAREDRLFMLHDAASKSLSGMAHEIKNPLGGLRGAAQLLERELNGSELTEYTRVIISEADRLRKLIDRMLTPALSPRPAPVNIHEVLEYVRKVAQAESASGLALRRDYDPSLPALRGDREQLIQALLNIVRNAAQAVEGQGEVLARTRIRRHCAIRRQTHRLAVQIEIIDDGPGVPAELEAHIFYPLVTGRAGGSGLGLSIAQSLIQAHHGLLQYERLEGRSCFRILLPVEGGDGG